MAVFWGHFAILLLKTIIRSVASVCVLMLRILLIQLLSSLISHLQMTWFLMGYDPPKLDLKVSFYFQFWWVTLCPVPKTLFPWFLKRLNPVRNEKKEYHLACIAAIAWCNYEYLQFLPSRNLVWWTTSGYWHFIHSKHPTPFGWVPQGNNLHNIIAQLFILSCSYQDCMVCHKHIIKRRLSLNKKLCVLTCKFKALNFLCDRTISYWNMWR